MTINPQQFQHVNFRLSVEPDRETLSCTTADQSHGGIALLTPLGHITLIKGGRTGGGGGG